MCVTLCRVVGVDDQDGGVVDQDGEFGAVGVADMEARDAPGSQSVCPKSCLSVWFLAPSKYGPWFSW